MCLKCSTNYQAFLRTKLPSGRREVNGNNGNVPVLKHPALRVMGDVSSQVHVLAILPAEKFPLVLSSRRLRGPHMAMKERVLCRNRIRKIIQPVAWLLFDAFQLHQHWSKRKRCDSFLVLKQIVKKNQMHNPSILYTTQ